MSHKRLAIINRRSCWVGKVYLIFALSVYLTVVQIIENRIDEAHRCSALRKLMYFPMAAYTTRCPGALYLR